MGKNKCKVKEIKDALEKRLTLILNSKGCLDKKFDIEYRELISSGTEIVIKDK